MTISTFHGALVRGAMYEAGVVTKTGAGQRLNNAMIALDTGPIDGDPEVQAIVASLLARFPGGPYAEALQFVAAAIGSPVQPVVAPPAGPTLTADEIVTIRDLNYLARSEYQLATKDPALNARFLAMSFAIRDMLAWTDPDANILLGMMAATAGGRYGPNRAVIDRYAAMVGVPVAAVAPPSDVPVQPPPSVEYGLWDNERTPIVGDPEFVRKVLDVLRYNTVRFDERVGFGMDPIQNTEARITLERGQILGVSNSNFQNDDEQMLPPGIVPKHANIWDICNSDGGMRAIQYCWFWMGKMVRNTLNRVPTIRATFDSRGNACWSGDESVTGKGQMYYEVADPDRREVALGTFIPGWRLRLRGSSVYGAFDVDLIQEAVDKAVAKAMAARGL